MAVPTQDNIFDLIMRIPIEWPFLEERIKFQTLSTLPSLYENVIRIDGLQQRVPIGCNLILGVEIEKHGSCSNLYKNSLELNASSQGLLQLVKTLWFLSRQMLQNTL